MGYEMKSIILYAQHRERERESKKQERTLQSMYLDRTPIRPRAVNWFELGGMGGIPELFSEEVGLLISVSAATASNLSAFRASLML